MKIQGTFRVSGAVTYIYRGDDHPYITGDLTIIDGDIVAFAPPEEADFIGDLYIWGDILFEKSNKQS